MPIYEFAATIENGTVTIPAEYALKMPARIRVLIMPEQEYHADKSAFFPDLRLSTKNFRFDREEANAR